jgi:hypothetical protein
LTNLPVGGPVDWADITNIPIDIADGDANTNLSEAQVEAYVANGPLNLNDKLSVSGTIESTSGGVIFPDGTIQETSAKFSGAPYRWNVFSTYDQNAGWLGQNRAELFGGVNPSNWSDGNALADQMSADKEILRTLFTRKGYGGKNALVVADTYAMYSSTNGRLVAALFRVKNTTGSIISWPLQTFVTSYPSWGERASIAVNGSLIWTSGSTSYDANDPSVNVNLPIPSNRTSTIIVVSSSTAPYSSYAQHRSLFLAFAGDSLVLPSGLQYVDDLDDATGGWEQ